MRHRDGCYLALVLVAITVAVSFTASAQTTAYPSRESNEGQVVVTVTPLTLSRTADAWRFEVRLNTHVIPIMQDLAAVSVLSDGKGHDERPLAWQGDPPGGHHRKGVLVFKPMSPPPESVTLKIRQIGSVPERMFAWTLTSP